MPHYFHMHVFARPIISLSSTIISAYPSRCSVPSSYNIVGQLTGYLTTGRSPSVLFTIRKERRSPSFLPLFGVEPTPYHRPCADCKARNGVFRSFTKAAINYELLTNKYGLDLRVVRPTKRSLSLVDRVPGSDPEPLN